MISKASSINYEKKKASSIRCCLFIIWILMVSSVFYGNHGRSKIGAGKNGKAHAKSALPIGPRVPTTPKPTTPKSVTDEANNAATVFDCGHGKYASCMPSGDRNCKPYRRCRAGRN
ncbi:uncharacterized protein LOC132286794 [Cornus florida]|uniref:uncharacterized protein LOC132286794 n=1 Tax=Cornus florida TaxID=4283 RepID=UPI002896C4FA|nr:uncharacterized protein LOC132286794 [Cornus florida]